MADKDGLKIAKDYHVNEAFANQGGFYVKGANNLDWGMKKHLSNIFDPKSGNTVMFAFDHGYFMGSTAGLERLALVIPKLMPYVDCLMGTRGALRTCVPAENRKAIALRVHFKSVEPKRLRALPHVQPEHIRHAGIILRLRRGFARHVEHRAESRLHRRSGGRKLPGHAGAFPVRHRVDARLTQNRLRVAHIHPRHIRHGHALGPRAAVRLGNAQQRQDLLKNLRGKRRGRRPAEIRLDLRLVDRHQQRDLRAFRRGKPDKRADVQV